MQGILGKNPPPTLIFHPAGQFNPLNQSRTVLPPPSTSYNVTGLQPYTLYRFQVVSENEMGKVASNPWITARTLEARE